MGTNIRIVIERYDRQIARWKFDRLLEFGRDYDTFSLMRDGNEYIPSITGTTRGLPTDRDPESCTCHPEDREFCMLPYVEDEFGTECSWLLLDEIVNVDWERPTVQYMSIPLRAVDAKRATNGDVSPSYPEPYELWCKSPAHRPTFVFVDDMQSRGDVQALDLRTLDGAWHLPGHSTHRDIAGRLLADPELMPEPGEPPPGAIFRDQTDGSYGWERGRRFPRTAWALVDWFEPLRVVCGQLYRWMLEEVERGSEGDEVRLVFGFS